MSIRSAETLLFLFVLLLLCMSIVGRPMHLLWVLRADAALRGCRVDVTRMPLGNFARMHPRTSRHSLALLSSVA